MVLYSILLVLYYWLYYTILYFILYLTLYFILFILFYWFYTNSKTILFDDFIEWFYTRKEVLIQSSFVVLCSLCFHCFLFGCVFINSIFVHFNLYINSYITFLNFSGKFFSNVRIHLFSDSSDESINFLFIFFYFILFYFC